MEGDQKVGVLVHKCQFEKNKFICLPTVTVHLINGKTGENLMNIDKETPLTTPPFNALAKKCEIPFWENVLICQYLYQDICDKNKPDNLFLFEICDNIQEPSSKFKVKELDVVKARLAWAFLKPISSQGALNVGQVARLQLYKVGKKCSVPHQTCPLFHLYSDHKRKKLAGSLYVEIKGVNMENDKTLKAVENKSQLDENVKTEATAAAEVSVTAVSVADWSRLPTQSCKLPNTKLAEVPVSHRGVSCITFSNSGLHLACGTFSKITIVNVLNRSDTTRLIGHSGLVYELQWAKDDSLLLSVSADCSAIVWNVKPISKTPCFVLPHPSFVYCGKWQTTGHGIVTGGKDLTIRFWKRSGVGFDLLEEIVGHKGFISALEIYNDNLMFSGDSSGQVMMWILENNKWGLTRKFTICEVQGSVIDTIHLHPEQRRVIVSARSRDSLMVDVATGSTVQIYSGASLSVRSVSCLSPCGSLLFSFGANNVINAWDCDNGTLIAEYEKIFTNFESELSGCIAYHPFEHMAAFAVLGCHYPVILLQYDYKNDESIKLGLRNFIKRESSADLVKTVNEPMISTNEMTHYPVDNSTQDKLAAIVRDIDRVLMAKRKMTSHLMSHVAPNN